MVLKCSTVIGPGGLELGHKTAQVNSSAIDVDIAIPEFASIMAVAMEDTFEF